MPGKHFSSSSSKVIGRRGFLALLPAALVACNPGRDLPPLPPSDSTGAYRLDAGDRVRIITFGVEELSNEFGISDAGTIELPLLGTVEAGGLTATELAERIEGELRSQKSPE